MYFKTGIYRKRGGGLGSIGTQQTCNNNYYYGGAAAVDSFVAMMRKRCASLEASLRASQPQPERFCDLLGQSNVSLDCIFE